MFMFEASHICPYVNVPTQTHTSLHTIIFASRVSQTCTAGHHCWTSADRRSIMEEGTQGVSQGRAFLPVFTERQGRPDNNGTCFYCPYSLWRGFALDGGTETRPDQTNNMGRSERRRYQISQVFQTSASYKSWGGQSDSKHKHRTFCPSNKPLSVSSTLQNGIKGICVKQYIIEFRKNRNMREVVRQGLLCNNYYGKPYWPYLKWNVINNKIQLVYQLKCLTNFCMSAFLLM